MRTGDEYLQIIYIVLKNSAALFLRKKTSSAL